MSAPCTKPRRVAVKLERVGARLPPMRISQPKEAVRAVAELIGDRAYETFVVLYLNARACVIGYDEATDHGVGGVTLQTSSIIRNALALGSPAIVTAHQHPSGDPSPSDDDRALWQKLRRQCDLMDVMLMDNLVIGDGDYYSESEGGVHEIS